LDEGFGRRRQLRGVRDADFPSMVLWPGRLFVLAPARPSPSAHTSNGTDLVAWTCSDSDTNQDWSETLFNSDSHQLHDGQQTSECAALYNSGSINPGNQAIIWACSANTSDQGWSPYYVDTVNGHDCYSFFNEKALESGTNDDFFMSFSIPDSGENGAYVTLTVYSGLNGQIWCEY
jgi:hypothetical protein